jgi:type II secretory pathway pseudopilin PulG
MKTSTNKGRSSGFTLTEVMVATALFTLVAISVLAAFKASVRWQRAGTSQAQFMANARVASDNILSLIEQGKTFSVPANSNCVKIFFPDMSCAMIYFDTGNGNFNVSSIDSVEDNTLKYDPGTGNTGDIYTLCTYVRPVDGDKWSNIFQMVQGSPDSLAIRFHVGDGTNVLDKSFSRTGEGYQGTEVRMSATPRNVQKWYNE